jgi:hypothetical protein
MEEHATLRLTELMKAKQQKAKATITTESAPAAAATANSVRTDGSTIQQPAANTSGAHAPAPGPAPSGESKVA